MAAKAGVFVSVTAWLYYRAVWSVPLLLPAGIWFYRQEEKNCIRKKQQQFEQQFKEMIQAVSAALCAGYSIENAIKESKKELLLLYPENARIVKELSVLIRKLRMQIPVEQAVQEFSDTVGLEEVKNFSAVFSTAKRTGGDMIAIIRRSITHISDKIDVQREVRTILAAKRYEFTVMSVIPYGMIGYMSLSFPEFMGQLYGNITGIGVMTICFVIYAGAYYLGVRLTEIEV